MEYNEIITYATACSGLTCPRCASNSFRKHGLCLGIQRFRCKKCGRCFKETINTPLHCIHDKLKMIRYAEALTGHLSIRRVASELEISVSTSFTWRHKILSSFISFTAVRKGDLPVGICQITLPRSYKGSRRIPEKPLSSTKTLLAAGARGIPCLLLLPDKYNTFRASKVLASSLPAEAAIATKPAGLLTRAVRLAGRSGVLNMALRKNLLHTTGLVQSELELWMVRFRGVATKYLQQYWNWFRAEACITVEQFTSECFARRQLQCYSDIRKG